MAHTLKLSIYCFSIRKGRTKEFVGFKEFFNNHFIEGEEKKYEVPKEILYKRFADSYFETFGDQFIKNIDETKAIGINTYNTMPKLNIIDGMVNGGITGIDQDIFDSSNAKAAESTIDKSKVTSLPYYFKIWMPYDSQVGVIMVQSYTETGVTSLFVDKFKQFFKTKEYIFDFERHVPKEFKEKFAKKSVVKEIALYKTKLSAKAREELNSLFADFEGLKVKISISGFKLDVDSFKEGLQDGRFIHSDLAAFEITDENEYETIATYEDVSGRESQAKVSKNLDIFPTIILNNDLKETGKEYPNYKKIQSHTDAILEKVKIDIEYSPENVDKN